MMMRDTESVSSISSDDSDPSHTNTPTPTSDLPEHAMGETMTQDTNIGVDSIGTSRERQDNDTATGG